MVGITTVRATAPRSSVRLEKPVGKFAVFENAGTGEARVNVPSAIFGLWGVGLAIWATIRAIKTGEIASVFTGAYRPTTSRRKSPTMFWIGIGFFGLVGTVGVAFLVVSITGL